MNDRNLAVFATKDASSESFSSTLKPRYTGVGRDVSGGAAAMHGYCRSPRECRWQRALITGIVGGPVVGALQALRCK